MKPEFILCSAIKRNKPKECVKHYHNNDIYKLGLSNTVNPDRIKQDAKRGVDTEKDGLSNLLTQARDTMNEIPDMD